MFEKVLDRLRGKQLPKLESGIASRSRGLEAFGLKFELDQVREAITTGRRRGGTVRVVEIGCGEGRLLLDLLSEYPDLELHGINHKPWPGMTGTESLRNTARIQGIFSPLQLAQLPLPEVHFYDAAELHFESQSVDLILSQVAIPYVRRKDRLLEEVWRVLKPGGLALLNIDVRVDDLPDYLRFPTPRFIVYQGQRFVPLASLLSEKQAEGYDLRLESQPSRKNDAREYINLIVRKSKLDPLALDLDPEPGSSFNLRILCPPHGPQQILWGYRSVFTRGTGPRPTEPGPG